MFDEQQNRIGLAVLGADLLYWSQLNYMGIVPVNGFLADEFMAFAGYIDIPCLRPTLELEHPPAARHALLAGIEVLLPENWFTPCAVGYDQIFFDMFPSVLNSDPAYEPARYDAELTWQKFWWRMSGGVFGPFIRQICEAWSCDVGDILAPVAQRRWGDSAYLDDESLGPVFGYRLTRP